MLKVTQANSSQSQLPTKASTECDLMEVCSFRSEHSSMHPERLQDQPLAHKSTPQKNDPAAAELDSRSGGGGTQGPLSQSFHIANQAVGTMSSNSSTEPGGSFVKSQKQKDHNNTDGVGVCDGTSYSRTAGLGKRGCSNSSESDDSTEVDDKQMHGSEGVNGTSGDKDRISFEDDDDERTDSADEGGATSDSNYPNLALNSRESKFRTTGDKLGTMEKTSGGFAIERHMTTGPVSPVNMVVGYGAESLALRVMEKASVASSPPINSPRHSSAGQSTPDTPNLLSPEMSVSQASSNSMAATGTSTVIPAPLSSLGQVQATPLLPSNGYNLPFETPWGWAPVYSPFPLQPSASSVTTPVPVPEVVPSAFMKPGSPVLLHGTVCQESEGVLIVNVRWRNKSYSGSLIDTGQHEWAPPRLSAVFSESVQFKDVYTKQDVEGPQVDIDVEDEEGKESNIPDVPMEVSSQKGAAEGDGWKLPASSARDPPSSGPAQVESQYSDISDSESSDHGGETARLRPPVACSSPSHHPQKPKANGYVAVQQQLLHASGNQPRQPSPSPVKLSSHRGQATPTTTVGAVANVHDASTTVGTQSDQTQDASGIVSNVRSTLLGSYPSPQKSMAGVLNPGQEQRHSYVAKGGTPVLASKGAHQPPNYSNLNTLVDVAIAAGAAPCVAEEGKGALGAPSSTQELSRADSLSHLNSSEQPKPTAGHSVLLYPTDQFQKAASPSSPSSSSLHGGPPQSCRSPSPHAGKPTEQPQQPSCLSSYDPALLGPTVVKKATLGYGPPGVDPTSLTSHKDSGVDSDSSGSGSIISTHTKKSKSSGRKKKHGHGATSASKDDGGGKGPETPALSSMNFTQFNVQLQPISPGIEQSTSKAFLAVAAGVAGGGGGHQMENSSTARQNSGTTTVLSPSNKHPTVGEAMQKKVPIVSEVSVGSPAGAAAGALKETTKVLAMTTPSSFAIADVVSSKPSDGIVTTSHISPALAGLLPPTAGPKVDALPFANYVQSSVAPVSTAMATPVAAVIQERLLPSPQPDSSKSSKRKRKADQADLPMEQERHVVAKEDQEFPTTRIPGMSLYPVPGPVTTPQFQPAKIKQQQGGSCNDSVQHSTSEDKLRMESFPPGFDYDPSLPMSMQYQLIAFENQQKQMKFKQYRQEEEIRQQQQQQQQQQFESLKKEDLDKPSKNKGQSKPRAPRKLKTEVGGNSGNPAQPCTINVPQLLPPMVSASPPTPPQQGLNPSSSSCALPPSTSCSSVSHSSMVGGQEMTNGARIMHFTSQSLTQAGKGDPSQKTARHGPSTVTSAAGTNSNNSTANRQQKPPSATKKTSKKSDAAQIKSEGDKNQAMMWSVSSAAGAPFINYTQIPTSIASLMPPFGSLQAIPLNQATIAQGPWGGVAPQLQQFSSSHPVQSDKPPKPDHSGGAMVGRSVSSGTSGTGGGGGGGGGGGSGGGGGESSSTSAGHHLGTNHVGRSESGSGKKTPVADWHHHQSGFTPVSSSVQGKGGPQSSSSKTLNKQGSFPKEHGSDSKQQQQSQQSVGSSGHSSRERAGPGKSDPSPAPHTISAQQPQPQVVVPSPTQPQLRGITQEDYLKQLHMQQYMELLQQGSAPTAYIHPEQQLALWQMQQLALGQLHMEPLTAATLLQQYHQQQQQQQQSETMAGHLHTANIVPFMHPLSIPHNIGGYYDTTNLAVLPYAIGNQKRE